MGQKWTRHSPSSSFSALLKKMLDNLLRLLFVMAVLPVVGRKRENLPSFHVFTAPILHPDDGVVEKSEYNNRV